MCRAGRSLLYAALTMACCVTLPDAVLAQPADGAARQEQQAWAARVANHIGRFTKHPDRERRLYCEAAREGSLAVQFTINRAGQVSNVRLVQSAKIRDLDQAVIAAVKRASPVPAPPASLPGASLKLQLPVVFSSKCVPDSAGG